MDKDNDFQIPARIQIWSEGTGRYRVDLTLFDTGRGINALLTGGESPHIGGVVLAIPRPSLTGEGWSSDDYLIPVPKHKDIDIAKPLAHALACVCRAPVTVSAGIHSDNLSLKEIELVRENCDKLLKRAVEAFISNG